MAALPGEYCAKIFPDLPNTPARSQPVEGQNRRCQAAYRQSSSGCAGTRRDPHDSPGLRQTIFRASPGSGARKAESLPSTSSDHAPVRPHSCSLRARPLAARRNAAQFHKEADQKARIAYPRSWTTKPLPCGRRYKETAACWAAWSKHCPDDPRQEKPNQKPSAVPVSTQSAGLAAMVRAQMLWLGSRPSG